MYSTQPTFIPSWLSRHPEQARTAGPKGRQLLMLLVAGWIAIGSSVEGAGLLAAETLDGGTPMASEQKSQTPRDEAEKVESEASGSRDSYPRSGSHLRLGSVANLDLRPDLSQSRPQQGPKEWVYDLRFEGAAFLKLHFRQLDLRHGDRLLLQSEHGSVETLLLSGPRSGEPFWSLSIAGETARLRLQYRRAYNRPPFQVDRIAIGENPLPGTSHLASSFPDTPPWAERGTQKSLCGPGDFEDAICYQGDAAKWANIRATAGILSIAGDELIWCTGIAISPRDLVLTTESCLPDSDACQNAELVFGYYNDSCGGSEIAETWSSYRCGETVASSPFGGMCEPDATHLDFALHSVLGNPTNTWGYADPLGSLPTSGEGLYIPQHAGGRPLEIAHGSGSDVVVDGAVLRYYGTLDTESSSTGSPIFRELDDRLVGLHHCGGCSSPGVGNRGVPMADLRPHLLPFLCESGDFLEAAPHGSFEPLTGNGDSVLDPGETWQLIPMLRNVSCQADAMAITASFEASPSSAPIELLDASSTFPDLAAGKTGAGTPIRFRLLDMAPCAGQVRLDLSSITAAAGGPFAGATSYAEIEVGEVPEEIYLHTSFDTGIGSEWTVVSGGNGEGEAATWTTTDPGDRQLLDPPFAIVDSAHLGPGFDQDESLISPLIDTTSHTAGRLRFRHDFRWFDGGLEEIADVDVRSSATGGAWARIARYEGADARGAVELDLAPYLAADLQIRFRYWNAEWEWWWALDDVRISGNDGRQCFTAIFLDGFESGTTAAWTPTP